MSLTLTEYVRRSALGTCAASFITLLWIIFLFEYTRYGWWDMILFGSVHNTIHESLTGVVPLFLAFRFAGHAPFSLFFPLRSSLLLRTPILVLGLILSHLANHSALRPDSGPVTVEGERNGNQAHLYQAEESARPLGRKFIVHSRAGKRQCCAKYGTRDGISRKR